MAIYLCVTYLEYNNTLLIKFVISDATKAWNLALNNIKTAETHFSAKRLIKVFVETLPI